MRGDEATLANAGQPGRGRNAGSPLRIPARGWLDILWRIKDMVLRDHIALIAAGIAFYGLLAVFPAITALMAFAGLLYAPSELVSALQGLTAVVPAEVGRILLDQAQSVASTQDGGLTLGLILGLSLALWSASTGVGSLIEGLNIAYGEEETRSFVKLRLITLAMTLSMIFGFIVAGILIVAVPVALAFLPVAPGMATAIKIVAYLPMTMVFVGGVVAFYRWAPDRARAKWRWLTPGAVLSSMLWLIASVGFSLYVQNFGSYNETFGSIAGVIVLLMWMWLSAFVVLLGAEFNSEIEAQTARDSTIGPKAPMGERGAVKADELGHVR